MARAAEHVKVDEEKLSQYAAALLKEEGSVLEMDPSCHFLAHGEQTLAFLITLDTVNFGSGYFPEILPDPRRSGYRTIAAALTEYFRRNGPFSAGELCCISSSRCALIFGLDVDHPASGELMKLFARALRDLGSFLLEKYGGRFRGLVEDAGGSAEKLVFLLSAMPLYHDVAPYRGQTVPFFKRAQLAAADLHIAFAGNGFGRFDDIERLTLFADNLVPHVLRHDDILVYETSLAQRIDAGDLLPAGSPQEVEIRGCAVYAVERMIEELRAGGVSVSAMELDNRLWHRGQRPEYRALPRHRTHTPFY